MLDTKVKVFHESISCFMKWSWNCISWNALKEKFYSVSFPLRLYRFWIHFHSYLLSCYKSFLSSFSVLVNYTMWSFNLFTASSCFPHFSRRPGFSRFRFFRIQVFPGPGFLGSRFFWIRVQGLGPGFRSSRYKAFIKLL